MVLDELLKCLLFQLGKGVDLFGECVGGVRFQIDGMVPVLLLWEPLCLFFAEDLAMSLVLFWEQWFRGWLVLFCYLGGFCLGCHSDSWVCPLFSYKQASFNLGLMGISYFDNYG